ncbi:MAG TPA: RagB/SusD family nutrient uptake outer membrane protein [Prolixibacteraceae bacterium]|nr:RagB/SusD family nutrient uptake outer membrane protein [Prolixibacteraceae bacterium]
MKMNIQSVIRTFAIGLIAVFTLSCSDDFFDQQAGNRIHPDQHYQTMVDVELSLYGAIIPLQEVLPNLIMVDGLRSDLMDVTPNASLWLREINNHVFSADNPYLDISAFYRSIINLNEVLVNLPKVYENDPNFDDFYMKYVTGGIMGMRAWVYLTLSRLQNEVVWIDGNLTELPDNLGQTFVSKEALIDSLIQQITPYIHTDQLLAEMQIPYFVNTKAMLGELYLEKNDYANAAAFLKLACESYGNGTTVLKVDRTFSRQSWMNIFISAENNATEVLAAMPYNLTERQANPLRMWLEGTYVVKPTAPIINLFNAQVGLKDYPGDESRGIGITIDTLFGSTTDMYIKKYSLDAGQEGFSSDIIISRAANLHLMLAEALNRSGEHNLALVLLNSGINGEKTKPAGYTTWSGNQGIRGRAYVKPHVLPEGVTDDYVITEWIEDRIIEERMLEMAYEGHRWFDLVRIAKRRGNPDFLAAKVAAKFSDPAQANAIREKLKDPKNWYIPLEK